MSNQLYMMSHNSCLISYTWCPHDSCLISFTWCPHNSCLISYTWCPIILVQSVIHDVPWFLFNTLYRMSYVHCPISYTGFPQSLFNQLYMMYYNSCPISYAWCPIILVLYVIQDVPCSLSNLLYMMSHNPIQGFP